MKLYGKLLLSMIAAGVLALAALALTMNWRLGHGFVDFINAADAERLPAIANALAEHYREAGGWQRLHDHPRIWHGLLRRARDLDEAQAERETGTPADADADAEPNPRELRIQRERRGHRHDPWVPLWSRLSVYDATRQRLLGRYAYEESARHQPIQVDGHTVGWVGLRKITRVRSQLGEAFLRDQHRGLLWASLVMVLMLTVLAALLARAWTRPIRRIGAVTRQLAGGDFSARAGPAGRDEIGVLARDIDFLAQSLGQADAARKRWMADAAHELRTPLAVLKGELEALQDGIRPLDREAIASLHAEATHLGALIDELRELALADAGALDYQMRPLDLAELLRECLEANAGRLAQHGLTLATDMPAYTVPVHGDARRLRQLLENLLENSLRYTDAGGRLQVTLSQQQDRVDLRFDDSAPGVADSVLPTLFEPFVRADPARTRGGSGLGLAICRRIVDAHAGTIGAEASPLGGLRVIVRLPRPLVGTP